MADDTINQQEADFIMVLSSEMISDVVEQYLNSEMYKKPVKVVDTKPTESGYAFGICFDVRTVEFTLEPLTTQEIDKKYANVIPSDSTASLYTGGKRNNKVKVSK